jgi:nitrite reductase (NADH) large subunit
MATEIWQCTVCGYFHEGPEPPEKCPVCAVGRDRFEPADTPATPAPPPRHWRCVVCDYIHEGDAPPASCPVCGAGADQFVEEGTAGSAPATAPAAGGVRRRLIVVGAGIAGLTAATVAREVDPEAEIVVYSAATELPYYRLNLTRFLAGEVDPHDLVIHPPEWYEQRHLQLRLGAVVQRLRPEAHEVELADGRREAFDRAILAVGARPFVPPIAGSGLSGVYCLRHLDEALAIQARARQQARFVGIGGGVLGLEIAGALARQGAQVSLLETADWLLPRQLNRKAGMYLGKYVVGLGLQLICGASTAAIAGNQQVEAVDLVDGRHLPADAVLLATGVRADLALAREAGLATATGLLVDDAMATSHADVFGAGDACEHRGVLYGLWAAAQAQGHVAGANAAGAAEQFLGLPRANTLKVLGLPLFSIGAVHPADDSWVGVESEADDHYLQFLFADGRLRGALLLGDDRAAAGCARAIQEQRDLSGLLRDCLDAEAISVRLARG